MIFQLESLFNTDGVTVPFDYETDLSGIIVSGQNPIVSPVHLTGAFSNKAGLVSLRGTASFEYRAACDRCAKITNRSFSFDFNHSLVQELNDDDNDEYLVVEGKKLDLDELAQEDINLFLPTKFLCKEDCKGLCPTCGKDLNTDQCDCKKPIDPRLEGLLQFLDD